MNKLAIAGFCAISLGMFGCAAEEASDEGAAASDLTAALGANEAIGCDAGSTKAALVGEAGGKATLITLTPAADLYALASRPGTLTASSGRWSWQGAGAAALSLDGDLKGTLTLGSELQVTCHRAAASEAASWATAKGLAVYAGEIDGLAATVTEEMASFSNDEESNENASAESPTYTVFAVETSRRSSLDLGTRVSGSAGALPGEEGEELLDENDWSYGGMGAAYNLGGGDDYGEWFQGASDGIYLSSDVTSGLGSARAGFIAHEKCRALSTLVDSAEPNAIEITVGGWTFFLPDAFAK